MTITEKIINATDSTPSISEDNIGWNTINDFLDIPDGFLTDDEKNVLLDAVNARIGTTLAEYPGDRNEAWEMWCNEDLVADFSDLQAIIDEES